MARPKNEHPTPAELVVLKILWEKGPLTVREVLDVLITKSHKRAYTSVMSLLNVMAEKKLVRRKRQGRAFLYEARSSRERTLGEMVGDLWERGFEGSASLLVTRLLERTSPTKTELDKIREVIETYRHNNPEDR